MLQLVSARLAPESFLLAHRFFYLAPGCRFFWRLGQCELAHGFFFLAWVKVIWHLSHFYWRLVQLNWRLFGSTIFSILDVPRRVAMSVPHCVDDVPLPNAPSADVPTAQEPANPQPAGVVVPQSNRRRRPPRGRYRRLSRHRLEDIFDDLRAHPDMSTAMLMERIKDISLKVSWSPLFCFLYSLLGLTARKRPCFANLSSFFWMASSHEMHVMNCSTNVCDAFPTTA